MTRILDTPQYIIKPSVRRMVVPELLKIFAGVIIFYFLIMLNLSLMGVPFPNSIKILTGVVLLLLVVLQVILSYLKSLKNKYEFYSNRLEYTGKKPGTIVFSEIDSLSFDQDMLDKVFGTGTIILQPMKFKIKGVPNSSQVYFYLQKLVKASKSPYMPQAQQTTSQQQEAQSQPQSQPQSTYQGQQSTQTQQQTNRFKY